MKTDVNIAAFTKEQLDQLFANAYYEAVIAGADMFQTVTLLEPLRQSIGKYSPMKAWSLMTLDHDRFDKDPFVEILVHLRNKYYSVYADNVIELVTTALADNEENGWQTWLVNYIEALMLATPDVFDVMCVTEFSFSEKYLLQKEKYCRLNKYMIQSRWVDCYETSLELAKIEWLHAEQRARLLIFAGQIYMYWFPDSHLAKKHIDEAAAVLEDSDITERAYAEYYKQMGNFEEARNHLANAQLKQIGHGLSNLLLNGDIAKDQGMTEVAEGRYKEALALNFLDTEAYSRLVSLYADPSMFEVKKSEIEPLVQKVKSLESDYPVNYNYYNINRDAGYAFSLSQDYKTSESYYQKAIAMQPHNNAAIVDLAYIFAYQGKYTESETYFFKAIENDPATFEAYWGLGWLFSQQKDAQKSKEYYEQCFTIRPSWDGLINYTIGIMYETLDYTDFAKDYYEKAVKANPASAEYLSRLGDVSEKQNKFSEAILAYEKATTLNGKDPLTWNKLGNLYFDQNDFEKAKGCYENAVANDAASIVYLKNLGLALQKLENWNESITVYSKALKLKANDPETLNAIGIAHYENKEFEKSITFYKHAIEACKSITDNKNEYVYWANIGLAYRDEGNFDEAEKAYLQSLSLNPGSLDNQNYIGILYYRMGKYSKAIEHYKKALEVRPDAQLFENIGLAYFDNNDYDAAILNFNEALKKAPDAHTTINYLGNVYFKQGDYLNARNEYEKAVKLQPENPVYLSNAGIGYYFDKLYKDAGQFFEKALVYGPDYLPALNYGGNCDLILADYKEAEVKYRKCISLSPAESLFYSNLGICLLKQNKMEEAEGYLNQAINLDKDNQEAITNLGFVAYKKGEIEKAREYFFKAFPGSEQDPFSYYEFLHPEENKDEIEKKLEEDPDDFAALWQMGTINYLNQNRDISKEYFHKALNIIFKDDNTFLESVNRLKTIEKPQRDEAISILVDLFKDDEILSQKLTDLENKIEG